MNITELDLQAIYQSTDYIMLFDTELRITEINPAAALRFNLARDYAVGQRLTDLMEERENDYRIRPMQEAIAHNKTFFFPSVSFHYTTGTYTHLILPLSDATKQRHLLTVMREHQPDESFDQHDLLSPLRN